MHEVTDERKAELYGVFLAVRRRRPALLFAPYKGLSGPHIGLMLFPYVEAADDRLRELANAINAFHRHIRSAEAWHEVYSGANTEERVEILIEHLWLLTEACIDAPYSLRGRFIEAVCTLSGIANGIAGGHRPTPPKNLRMTEAIAFAKSWSAWSNLAPILSSIGDQAYLDATADLRNQRQHGSPVGIEIGKTVRITRRAEDGRQRISMGLNAPIAIGSILPVVVAEHHKILASFGEFRALVNEQLAAIAAHYSGLPT